MQLIAYKYKGAMLKITKKLQEQFEFETPLNTVGDALSELNAHYGERLDMYIKQDISIVLKADNHNSCLITQQKDLQMALGKENTITFFEVFSGG